MRHDCVAVSLVIAILVGCDSDAGSTPLEPEPPALETVIAEALESSFRDTETRIFPYLDGIAQVGPLRLTHATLQSQLSSASEPVLLELIEDVAAALDALRMEPEMAEDPDLTVVEINLFHLRSTLKPNG